MQQIVIFASGSGTNAAAIISYFKKRKTASVAQVFCNTKNAKVFERCEKLGIPCTLFNRADFFASENILNQLKQYADYIVLAGFLWKVPENIIENFSNKIINIHPALLPKYGGKGMYGMHVHKAVKENKEKETGITVHLVNEAYDEGAILFQAKTNIDKDDTPECIAQKVHVLEHTHFSRVIEELILSRNG